MNIASSDLDNLWRELAWMTEMFDWFHRRDCFEVRNGAIEASPIRSQITIFTSGFT